MFSFVDFALLLKSNIFKKNFSAGNLFNIQTDPNAKSLKQSFPKKHLPPTTHVFGFSAAPQAKFLFEFYVLFYSFRTKYVAQSTIYGSRCTKLYFLFVKTSRFLTIGTSALVE